MSGARTQPACKGTSDRHTRRLLWAVHTIHSLCSSTCQVHHPACPSMMAILWLISIAFFGWTIPKHSFNSVFCSCLNALACFMIPAVMLGGCLEPALVLLRLCVQASLPEAPSGSFCSRNMNEITNEHQWTANSNNAIAISNNIAMACPTTTSSQELASGC